MLGEFKPRGTDWFDSSPNGELCKMLTLKHEILNSLTSFDRNPRRILAYSCIFSCSDCRFRHSDSSASSQSRSLISSCPWCKLVQYLEEKMEMFEVWHNLHICHSKIHLHICVWDIFGKMVTICGRLRTYGPKAGINMSCDSHFWQNLPEYPGGQLQVNGSVHWPRADMEGDKQPPHTGHLRWTIWGTLM